MRRAIILGSGSDLGRALASRLQRDGWTVAGTRHTVEVLRLEPWDLIVCCYGSMEPVGPWHEVEADAWEGAFRANLFLPVRQVRQLYPHRRPGASVCFFSGAGTSGPAPTYSAYCAAKVALVKTTELMDDESPDCKFFVLGPGIVRTKIHEQTLAARDRAANRERVEDFLASGVPGTPMDDIYACLMACVAAPKAAVGGRNVYVPGDDWSRLGDLSGTTDIFKLRRDRDDYLRGENIRG